MNVIDFIPGLVSVDTRVGLAHLDQGLRESLRVDLRSLPAQQQLDALGQQAAATQKTIRQLQRQAEEYRKQQQVSQQAQMIAQVNQHEIYLKQLEVERTRLNAELQRQYRQAQDQEIVRVVADLYNQALYYQRQGSLIDFVVVTLAVFRLHQQVYGNLTNPDDRLQSASLQGKLFDALAGILEAYTSAQTLTQQYVAALSPVLEIQQRVSRTLADTQGTIETVTTLQSAPTDADWTRSLGACDAATAGLKSGLNQVAAAKSELAGLLDTPALREVFFPLDTTLSGTRLAARWALWKQSVDTALNANLEALYQGLGKLKTALQQREQQLRSSETEVKRLRGLHQLGRNAAQLVTILAPYQSRYDVLAELHRALPTPQPETEPAELVRTFIGAARLQHAIQAEFMPYQQALDASDFGRGGRLSAEVVRQLASLTGIEGVLALGDLTAEYALYDKIRQLAAEIGETVKTSRRLIAQVVESDDRFEATLVYLRGCLPEAQVREVEEQLAGRKAGMLDRTRGLVRGERGKELDRRRQLLDSLLQHAGAAESLPEAELPYQPVVPKAASFSLKPARTIPLPQSTLGRVGLFLGATIVFIGLIAAAVVLAGGDNALAPHSTATSAAVAGVQSTATPARTPVTPKRPTTTTKPTDTLAPTDTPAPTHTPTVTLTPSVTPTPSDTPTPSLTPTASKTPTRTLTPSRTPTPTRTRTPTRTPDPRLEYAVVDIRELDAYTDNHILEQVKLTGRVFNTGLDFFQIMVRKPGGSYYDTIPVVITYTGIPRPAGIYEDTVVVVYGLVMGRQEGTNALGGTISQLWIDADIIDIQ